MRLLYLLVIIGLVVVVASVNLNDLPRMRDWNVDQFPTALTGDVLFAGAQVAPAVVYHHWTETAIVAFLDGYWSECGGGAILRAVRVSALAPHPVEVDTTLGVPYHGCYEMPHMAMTDDGDVTLLGVRAGPDSTMFLLYETLDQGRTWERACDSLPLAADASIMAFQAIRGSRRGFVLVDHSAARGVTLRFSDDGGRTWYHNSAATGTALRAWSRLQEAVRLEQCDANRWLLVGDDGTFRVSGSQGRNWASDTRVPLRGLAPETQTLFATFYDMEHQRPGFGAAVVDRNTHQWLYQDGGVNETARLYFPLGDWRRRYFAGSLCNGDDADALRYVLHNWNAPIVPMPGARWVPSNNSGASWAILDARGCTPSPTQAIEPPGRLCWAYCQPDASQLGTATVCTPRMYPTGRFSSSTLSLATPAFPELIAATLVEGRTHLAIQVTDRFDLKLALGSTPVGTPANLRKQATRWGQGVYMTDDFGAGLAAHCNDSTGKCVYLTAYSQITTNVSVPDVDARPRTQPNWDRHERSHIELRRVDIGR